MISTNFRFQSKIDKKQIFAVKHKPPPGAPLKAAIMISHGMGDYKERYSHFASFLCTQGFAVYINDHRGHGETAAVDGSFGIFSSKDGWFAAVSDILSLHNLLRDEHPDIPVFLLGHSLGAFLATTFAVKWGPLLDGVLLSGSGYPSPLAIKSSKAAITAASTTFGTERSLFMINALCLAGYALSVRRPKTEFDWICSDPAVVQQFMASPKSRFLYSNSFYLDLIEGLNFNFKLDNLRLIPPELPFYFFSGTEDPVGDHTRGVIKSAELLKEAGVGDITTKFYDGLRHEVLNEIERETVFSDLLSWINLHI